MLYCFKEEIFFLIPKFYFNYIFVLQNRVRAEIEKVSAENNGEVNFNDLQRLTYLECCIKESLRLYPTVPTISRKTQENLVLSKNLIYKKNF